MPPRSRKKTHAEGPTPRPHADESKELKASPHYPGVNQESVAPRRSTRIAERLNSKTVRSTVPKLLDPTALPTSSKSTVARKDSRGRHSRYKTSEVAPETSSAPQTSNTSTVRATRAARSIHNDVPVRNISRATQTSLRSEPEGSSDVDHTTFHQPWWQLGQGSSQNQIDILPSSRVQEEDSTEDLETSSDDESHRSSVLERMREQYRSAGFNPPTRFSGMATTTGTENSIRSSRTTATSRPRAKKEKTSYRYTDKAFSDILKAHAINVDALQEDRIDPATQSLIDKIRTISSLGVTARQSNSLWEKDFAKCRRSHEKSFQHSAMMSMLLRDQLTSALEWEPEASLVTPDRPPCRTSTPAEYKFKRLLCTSDKCAISRPTADLVVAFKTPSILPSGIDVLAIDDLGDLKSHILAEGGEHYPSDRAFHFFSIEAKSIKSGKDDRQAQYQNLNFASIALFNIYKCMKAADQLDIFFDKVRFFSVTASAQHFSLRIHIPVEADLVRAINVEYPIKFEHVDIESFDREVINKESDICGYLYNILQSYGAKVLLPILKATVKELFDRRDEGVRQTNPTLRNGLSRIPPPDAKRGLDADDDPHHSFSLPPSSKARLEEDSNTGNEDISDSSSVLSGPEE
ncbi:hypothetical protein MMC25_006304 [Agyrium rufum]|nr:hypothetical protein [Agyrium rufum]